MVSHELPLPNAGPQRIPFVLASSLLVAHALTDADARLERHFPTLSKATWGDALRQLQPDLLVNGRRATFDWLDLARRVQALAGSVELPAPAPPTDGPTAAESAAALRAYQRQALPALAELPESLRAGATLAYVLLTQLAHGQALAARGDDAIQGARQPPATTSCPPVPEPLVPSPAPAQRTMESLEQSRPGPGVVRSLSGRGPTNTHSPAPRRKQSKSRTFRDMAERHPRPNGKFGFTVRELCTTMRISAASLTEARANPGHLSVNKVVALAEAMEEHPLHVLADLLTEAAAKKRRERKKRVPPPQRPENSSFK